MWSLCVSMLSDGVPRYKYPQKYFGVLSKRLPCAYIYTYYAET